MISKPMRGTLPSRTHPLQRGLIGCWLFNEGTGSKVQDFSGNNNNGTFTGCVWVPGKSGVVGYDAYFEDDPAKVSLDRRVTLAGDFTAVVWGIIPDFTQQRVIIGYGELEHWIRIYSTTNWMIDTSTGISYLTPGFTFPLNVSINLAIRRKNGVFSAYFNGAPGATTITNTGYLYIDRLGSKGGSGYNWHGNMTQLRMYDRALHDDEIRLLYRNPFAEWDN